MSGEEAVVAGLWLIARQAGMVEGGVMSGPGLQDCMARLPLVAILRGVQPHEAVEIGGALVDEGFALIEVPLNSPEPLDQHRRPVRGVRRNRADRRRNVLDPRWTCEDRAAGGRLIVMPHSDPR